MTKVKLPMDMCSPTAIGEIRNKIGPREESLVANVCKIKETADQILQKFKTVSESDPNAPIDIQEELKFYNDKFTFIQNLARLSQVK